MINYQVHDELMVRHDTAMTHDLEPCTKFSPFYWPFLTERADWGISGHRPRWRPSRVRTRCRGSLRAGCGRWPGCDTRPACAAAPPRARLSSSSCFYRLCPCLRAAMHIIPLLYFQRFTSHLNLEFIMCVGPMHLVHTRDTGSLYNKYFVLTHANDRVRLRFPQAVSCCPSINVYVRMCVLSWTVGLPIVTNNINYSDKN